MDRERASATVQDRPLASSLVPPSYTAPSGALGGSKEAHGRCPLLLPCPRGSRQGRLPPVFEFSWSLS